jgi:hypothetical protein
LKSAAALVAAVTAIGLSGTAAWAAAPDNDVYLGAVEILALPYETTLDTTEATTDADDDKVLAAGCEAPATDASVWYKYTATEDGVLYADVSGSDYSVGVAVGTGTPASFNLETCSADGAVWEATAGETYVLLVFDWQGDGFGNGGTLILTQDMASFSHLRNNDFTGDGNADVVSRDANGRLYVYPGNGSGGWKARIAYGTGWNAYTAILAPGDWDGDGFADLMARDKSGYLYLYSGDGESHFGARHRIGMGWNSMTAIVGVGDFDGDFAMDLVSRDGLGKLYLYPGDGTGGFLPRVPIGTGWKVMTAILGIGDFDGDDFTDLVARDSLGKLWLYPGNGDGGFLARHQIGTGWQGFTALVAPQDFNGDGYVDVLARASTGYLYLYKGDGEGYWLGSKRVGTGWNSMTAIVS